MTDRDDLLRRVRRANPSPPGQDLPAEVADSRPLAAWLIEGKYAMADTTRPESRHRGRGPAIAAAAMAAALAVALPLLFLRGGEKSPAVSTTAASITTTTGETSTVATTTVLGVEIASTEVVGPLVAVSAQEAWALWGRGGIAHFVDGVWEAFAVDLPAGGLSRAALPLAVAPDGTVWVAGGAGVFSFAGGEWTPRVDYPVYDLGVASDGTVWITAESWPLARWDGESFVPLDPSWDEPSPNTSGWHPGSPPQLAVAADGQVWGVHAITAGAHQLMRYDGATLEEVPIADYPPLGEEVVAMEAAPNGDLWIMGWDHSNPPAGDQALWLARFDGETWTSYDRPFFPIEDEMAVGPDGVVWSTTGNDLLSFDGSDWTYHIQGQGVAAVDVAPDGTVWYIDEEGAHTLANQTTTTAAPTTTTWMPPVEVLLASPYTSLAVVSAEEAWAFGPASNDAWAIAHLVDGAWAWVDLPGFDADLGVSGLVVAPDGTVWVSGGGGVFSFDGVEWTRRFDYAAGGVAVAPDGTVWIGGGPWLARWEDGSWSPVTAFDWDGPEPMDMTAYEANYIGFPQPGVATSDGQVWMIAYVRGWPDCTWLLHYDGATVWRVVSADHTLHDGGPFDNRECNDTFVDVEAAPNGDVWALLDPHDRGDWLLGRFDGEVWTTYTPPFEDGDVFLVDGMAVGPDGLVWFALEDGLLAFDGSDWTYHLQGQQVSAVDLAPDGTVWYIDEAGPHTFGNQ